MCGNVSYFSSLCFESCWSSTITNGVAQYRRNIPCTVLELELQDQDACRATFTLTALVEDSPLPLHMLCIICSWVYHSNLCLRCHMVLHCVSRCLCASFSFLSVAPFMLRLSPKSLHPVGPFLKSNGRKWSHWTILNSESTCVTYVCFWQRQPWNNLKT